MMFRIFSGWDRRQVEAAEVFKFSVEANASIPVEVRFLKIGEMPIQRMGTTEFTYSRFLVSYLCEYEGRALFVDGCDMLCLGDMAELAEMPMEKPIYVAWHPGKDRRRPRSWTSMMLMDCHASLWTPALVADESDDALMRLGDFNDTEIGELPPGWNVLMEPGEEPIDDVKLAHWSYLSDPNGGSWIDRSGSKLWAEWRERWRLSSAPVA